MADKDTPLLMTLLANWGKYPKRKTLVKTQIDKVKG
jgi:hypothetical protein